MRILSSVSFFPSFFIRASATTACLALIAAPEIAAACASVQPGLWICGFVEADGELSADPPGESVSLDFDEEVALPPEEEEFIAETEFSRARAFVEGGPGWARINGTTTATMPAPGDSGARTHFTILFADTLTITSPGQQGPGTITMGAFFSGNLTTGCVGPSSDGNGSSFASFGAPGLLAEHYAQVFCNFPGIPQYQLIDEWLGGEASFEFGVPFTFYYRLEIRGSAGGSMIEQGSVGSGAGWEADFGNTIEWAGLSDLRDAQGVPIADYQVTSLSGTDYRLPIPEPDRDLGLAAAGAALGLITRPRRRRPVRGHIRSRGPVAAAGLLAGLTGLAAGAVSAFDGVLEINQVCAVQTGCFSGDTAGFPITIDGSAGHSYRLTSDLVVPNENTDGIRVTAPNTSIDLSGFEIVRAGCVGATVDCRPTSGTGSGVEASSGVNVRGLSVRNGTISGMGNHGVLVGQQGEARNLRVRWNRVHGIAAGAGSIVADNMAFQNGGGGISALQGANVHHNTAYLNTGFGLDLSAAGYQGNVMTSNTSGSVSGGVDLGGNACDGTATCP